MKTHSSVENNSISVHEFPVKYDNGGVFWEQQNNAIFAGGSPVYAQLFDVLTYSETWQFSFEYLGAGEQGLSPQSARHFGNVLEPFDDPANPPLLNIHGTVVIGAAEIDDVQIFPFIGITDQPPVLDNFAYVSHMMLPPTPNRTGNSNVVSWDETILLSEEIANINFPEPFNDPTRRYVVPGFIVYNHSSSSRSVANMSLSGTCGARYILRDLNSFDSRR